MTDSLLDAPVPADQRAFWSALDREADRVGPTDPALALRLLDRQRELPTRWVDQDARQTHWGREIYFFARAYGALDDDTLTGDFDAAVRAATERVGSATGADAQRAAVATVSQVLLVAHDLDREED